VRPRTLARPGWTDRGLCAGHGLDGVAYWAERAAGRIVKLAGENRDYVSALAWLNAAEARKLPGADPQPYGDLIVDEDLHKHLTRALAEHNDAAGSSSRVERLLIMAHPASLDAGEITDKGYVNQRKVLIRRAALVELLYAEPVPAGVIVAERHRDAL
jgi:feruloyl-CoA synthase